MLYWKNCNYPSHTIYPFKISLSCSFMVLLTISSKEFKSTLAGSFKILECKLFPSVLLQSFNSLGVATREILSQKEQHPSKHAFHHRPRAQRCPRGIQSCHWHQTLPEKELFSTWHKSVLSFRYGALFSLLRGKAHFPIQGKSLMETKLLEDTLKFRLCHSGVSEGQDWKVLFRSD